MSTGTGGAEPSENKSRVAWYRIPSSLILIIVIAFGFWVIRLVSWPARVPTEKQVTVQPAVSGLEMATISSRMPTAAARIVQHKHTIADAGIARSTDLTGTLASRPKVGNLLLAFGSAGFGCVVARGWTLLGTDPSDFTAVAYRIAQPGDGAMFVPFTTPTANSYTLELVEIAGGPGIMGSPQGGGGFTDASTITNSFSFRIPQRGGMIFQLYAAGPIGNGAPTSFGSTLPSGQKQSLIDRVPQYKFASELIVQATTTDPRKSLQPFTARQTFTFAKHIAPGNIVAGWLVWVGGKTN